MLEALAGAARGALAFARRHPLAFSLLAVLPPVAILALAVSTPFFGTNDDAWMMLNLSGRVTSSEPTEHVIFMNIFLSRALAALYRAAGEVPWYGWTFLAAVAAGLTAMLHALLVQGAGLVRLGLWAVCLVFAGLSFAVELQFTMVSFVAGLGAVFLFHAALRAHIEGRAAAGRTAARVAAAALLAGLSYAIRGEALFLVLVLSLPVLLLVALDARRAGALKPLAAAAAGSALFVAALGLGHEAAYGRDAEWRRYRELNRLKSWFIDYGRIPYDDETRPVFDAVGWSEVDYLMMTSWFYVDPETYSLENMRRIVSHFPPTEWKPVPRALASLSIMSRHWTRQNLLWVAAPLVVGIYYLGIRRRAKALTLAATATLALALPVFLLAFLHSPGRVYQPTVMSVCWFALLLAGDRPRPPGEGVPESTLRRRGWTFVGLALVLMAVLDRVPIKGVLAESRTVVAANRELRASLAELAPRRDQTYVSWGTGFAFEHILPLEPKGYLDGLRVISLGAANGSPLQAAMMAAQDVPDVARALFERDDVFLVGRDASPGHLPLLVPYIRQHYGEPVRLVLRRETAAIAVWAVEPDATEDGAGEAAPGDGESAS